MHRLYTDLRFAIRRLGKAPGYTAVAVLTLGLAIGGNTGIFGFVNAVLIQPLPYPDADRIVRVLEVPPGGGRNGISTLDYLDWQRLNTVFDFIAARVRSPASLTGGAEPVRLFGARVTPHYFDVFGIKAAIGRTFVDGDDRPGRDHVVLLSNALWRSQFGADPDIVGRTLQLDGEAQVVIGVLPAGTAFERSGTLLWRPLTFGPANMTRNYYWFGAVARLKRGVTLAQARREMDAIGARLAHDYPDTNKDWGVAVDPMAETIVGREVRSSLYVLFAAVGMVLLIACANLASLALMRVVAREREIAIRVALGAGRAALVRQFLTESIVLSLLGGVAGLAIGRQTIGAITSALPPFTLPPEANVRLDPAVLGFAFLLTLLTGILVGLLPAWHATRSNLCPSLKQGGTGTTGGAPTRARNALVIAEVALAFVLLTGAGLLIRSLGKLGRVDVGFDSRNVLTFELPIAARNHPTTAALNADVRALRERIGAVPGVTDVALTSALPLQGWGYGMTFQIAGHPVAEPSKRPLGFFKMVSSSYFRTLSMHLIQGRTLAESDVAGAVPVTVITQTTAKRYFGDTNPIGQHLLVQQIVPGATRLGAEIPWEIVGVVADESVAGIENAENNRGLYVTTEQSPTYSLAVVVRCATTPSTLATAIVTAVHAVDPDQPVSNVKTLDAIKDDALVGQRVRARLLGIFAAGSLLLAALGIYGVLSYSVAQRTREIGVRTALGASRRDILRLVLASGVRLAVVGVGIGFVGMLAVSRVLASMLFGVTGHDPLTLTAAGLILPAVALLACIVPARRAMKVDPLIALRTE